MVLCGDVATDLTSRIIGQSHPPQRQAISRATDSHKEYLIHVISHRKNKSIPPCYALVSDWSASGSWYRLKMVIENTQERR